MIYWRDRRLSFIRSPTLLRLELENCLIVRFGFGVAVSQILVPFFAEKMPSWSQNQSAEIDHLFLDHGGRTVISWSLNPPKMIREEERRTASLNERTEAAGKCQEKGYLLGFHFDPIIDHEGWERGYEETISFLFRRIDPGRVAWISLGGFRYPPQLKAIARTVSQIRGSSWESCFPERMRSSVTSRDPRGDVSQAGAMAP
jgi:hypothetical protein